MDKKRLKLILITGILTVILGVFSFGVTTYYGIFSLVVCYIIGLIFSIICFIQAIRKHINVVGPVLAAAGYGWGAFVFAICLSFPDGGLFIPGGYLGILVFIAGGILMIILNNYTPNPEVKEGQ